MPSGGSYLFIPVIIATLKGNGSGFAGPIVRFVRGNWDPKGQELVKPSVTTKLCFWAGIALTLVVDQELVYLIIVGSFIAIKLSSILVRERSEQKKRAKRAFFPSSFNSKSNARNPGQIGLKTAILALRERNERNEKRAKRVFSKLIHFDLPVPFQQKKARGNRRLNTKVMIRLSFHLLLLLLVQAASTGTQVEKVVKVGCD